MKLIITENQYKNLIEQQSLNLKGKTVAPGISAKHSSNYVSKDEENLFITGLNKIISSHKFALPIHVRCFIHFLIGRTSPFTEKDMTAEERDFLKKAALGAGREGFTYPYWTKLSNNHRPLKNKSYADLVIRPMATQFHDFLGRTSPSNIKISPDKTRVNIVDNYDMNVRDQSKSQEDVIKLFKSRFSNFTKNSDRLYLVIRSLGDVRELGGYNGYPVNINL
jgi:hypothetical protein